MKIKFLFLLNVVGVMLLFTQCSDLFETDISNKKIKIFAPSDKMATKIADVLFIWEGDADIKLYNLQVVTPSYELIQNVVMDTTIKTTKFLVKNIATGNYKCRVVGINGKSRCYSDTLSFTIVDAATPK